MPQKFEIAPRTILFTILLLVGGWFLIYIHDILYLLFISFILMSALRPLVDRIEKLRIPRAGAILLVYVVLISLIVLGGTVIFPPMINETVRLINNFPQYLSPLSPYIKINVETLIQQIAPLGQNVLMVTIGIFSNLISIVTILVFSFYFLHARTHLPGFIELFLGPQISRQAVNIVSRVEERMGAWVRGQIILCLIIGQASFIGLTLLGINYALPLALLAGILEAVPIVGPNISAIPAILVALTVSKGLALAVAGLYFLIQQLENNVVVPNVMKRTVGLPPLAILLALMIGGRLGGVLGIIIAVPTLLAAQTIALELLRKDTKPTK
jgi:predicted PurR-regulated permease PerM